MKNKNHDRYSLCQIARVLRGIEIDSLTTGERRIYRELVDAEIVFDQDADDGFDEVTFTPEALEFLDEYDGD